MESRTSQSSLPGWRFWFTWLLATLAGAVAGLLASMPVQAILMAALPSQPPPPWTPTETALIVLFKGAEGGMMGAGMGFGQWLVLRRRLPGTGAWVLATALACLAQGIFRWSLPYDMPPWQVGTVITLSWGVFFGLFQWFVLRGRVRRAGWWFWINVASGLPGAAGMAAPAFLPIQLASWLGWVVGGAAFVLPFAVAAGAMVWLLRQDTGISPPALPSEPGGLAAT